MADLQDISLDQLHPHPDNPRIGLRDDVVERLTAEITANGFGPEHAILARPYGDGFQVVSGHHRLEAARQAGVAEVPVWVREMDDDEAYMLLVLANTQGELSRIERAVHVYGYGERAEGHGRGQKGGLSEYARKLDVAQPRISEQYAVGAVVERYRTSDTFSELVERDPYSQLLEISKAASAVHSVLVDALVKHGWTVSDARHHVQQIKAFGIPTEWAFWLPCDLAGVEPWFEDYKGEDPDGYALAVNIHRRNLSKGQIAMVAAQALLKNSSQPKIAAMAGVSQTYIAHAAIVIDYASELVDAVADGGMPLNDAYAEARVRKAEADSEAAKLAELRKLNQQLAVLVENGVRNLADALKEANHRAVIAEVDKILTADEAPEPTFTSRAEAGAIGWTEAATLARQWQHARGEHHRARAVHGGRGGGAPSAHPGRRGASGEGAAGAGAGTEGGGAEKRGAGARRPCPPWAAAFVQLGRKQARRPRYPQGRRHRHGLLRQHPRQGRARP